jgi:methyl-accepting chemotaxis protein
MMISAAAIAAHHVVFFFLVPQSLLNHHCPSFSIVLIHAGFVIAEVIPGAFIASRFGRFITAQQVATGQLSTSAEDMAHGARGVDEVNRAVHSFAENQSSSLAELLRANGAVRIISSENARRAGEALGTARAVCELVEKGNEFLKLLRQAITEFSESSGKIGRITKTIDEIAFQTNILALNAAVEAARAGESGVGFAVVADEVRSLAQKSAAAARDTAGLIDASLQRADEGVSRLRHVGEVFDEILSRSTRLSESVTDVNAAIEQQCSEVDRVRNLTERIQLAMRGMKEKTAAGTAAGDVLIQNAEQLQALVHEIAALTR